MATYILKQDICGDFHMTTVENARRRIENAREYWHFHRYSGFTSMDDVLDYVEKFFHIDRSEIETKIVELPKAT